MIAPPSPINDAERVETLKSLNILDVLPEERFDRITRIAQKVFNVPIALVSIIDADRQWFKSHIGLNVSETIRDISFFGHAILGDEMFVIEDTLQDIRFADNPLVIGGPKIRFYAGCPIKAPNGHKLGTLCIIDQIPRLFDEQDIKLITDLALIVEQGFAALNLACHDELTHLSNRRGFMMLAHNA